MAMNKKETAALQQALADLDEARRLLPALRWPTDPLPTPIDKEAAWAQKEAEGAPWGKRYVTGWAATGYNGEAGALRVWCENIRHGYGYAPRQHSSASQGEGPDIYATKVEALIVARFKLATECARNLAKIDKKIEQERAAPTDFNAPVSPITGE